METVIRMRLSELNNISIEKLRAIVRQSSGQEDPEFAVLINDDPSSNYLKELKTSMEQIEKGETVSFTMEELSDYLTKNLDK